MDSDNSSNRSNSPAESQEEDPDGYLGRFPFPYGTHRGVAIRDVPQDHVWWALRPDNRHEGWYEAMYEDNTRLLDDKYKSCSPGSEPIWFSKTYRGHRLDLVYGRKGFMRWCFSSKRHEGGWIYRLKDLVRRLLEWREAHPERSGPRRRTKAPDIQNPVGEAIGPWNDGAGSAAEDDSYERDGFVVSDDDEGESSDNEESSEEEFDKEEVVDGNKSSDEDNSAVDDARDSDDSTDSDAETTPVRRKCRRANIVLSDDSESDKEASDDARTSARKLGRKYRGEVSEEEVEATARKASKRVRH